MTDTFVIRLNGELKTYHDFDDIPMEIDNVIEFRPDIPKGPHSPEEQLQIDLWLERFIDIMSREKGK